ncbi:MAG: phosphonate ABC transporter ATP-binding protein [Paracoccaceae bacterium]
MSDALVIERLSKSYVEGGASALDGVDLRVEGAEVVAVIGPSGAGKSTLIRCVNRLVEPTSGRIVLDGEAITGLSTRGLRRARRRIAMIFQEFNLVERLSVMENVLSGRLGHVSFLAAALRRFPQRDIDAAFDLLDAVGLTGFENVRADALSGGQRQRVGIARALMQEPKILLVDEPTSALDPRTARTILGLIARLARERGLPVLVNIHDVSLALDFAERVVGLSEGRVVFDGPPEAVDADALTRVYGEADWSSVLRRSEEPAPMPEGHAAQ